MSSIFVNPYTGYGDGEILDWILDTTNWDDEGIWIDGEVWAD